MSAGSYTPSKEEIAALDSIPESFDPAPVKQDSITIHSGDESKALDDAYMSIHPDGQAATRYAESAWKAAMGGKSYRKARREALEEQASLLESEYVKSVEGKSVLSPEQVDARISTLGSGPLDTFDAAYQKAMEEKTRMSVEDVKRKGKLPDNVWARDVVASTIGVGSSIGSLAQRGIAAASSPFHDGFSDAADRLADKFNEQADYYRQIARDKDVDENRAAWLHEMVRGALESFGKASLAAPAGTAAVISSFGADAANAAITEAREAGLQGVDVAKHAVAQGVLEGGIAGAFSLVGMGGFESLMAGGSAKGISKTIVKNMDDIVSASNGGLRGVGKNVIKSLKPELVEEVLTTVTQQYASEWSGVADPKKRDMANQIFQTVGQTILMVGMGGVGSYKTKAQALEDKGKMISDVAAHYGLSEDVVGKLVDKHIVSPKGSMKRFERALESKYRATSDGIKAWVEDNLGPAEELAAKDEPSRKNLKDAGLQIEDAEDRAAVLPVIKEEVGAGQVSTPDGAEQEKRKPEPEGDVIGSLTKYRVSTEDLGDINIGFRRASDGSVIITYDDDVKRRPSEYNADFANSMSTEELIRYTFEPIGFNGASRTSDETILRRKKRQATEGEAERQEDYDPMLPAVIKKQEDGISDQELKTPEWIQDKPKDVKRFSELEDQVKRAVHQYRGKSPQIARPGEGGKLVSEMTEGETADAIGRSHIPGLYNNRQYAEDRETHTFKKAISVEGLQEINDFGGGHDSGDAFLEAVGTDLANLDGNARVYHVAGPKFAIGATSQADLDAAMKQVEVLQQKYFMEVSDKEYNDRFKHKIKDMSPEDRAHWLVTDEGTNLDNERKFEEDRRAMPDAPISYIDGDSWSLLKKVLVKAHGDVGGIEAMDEIILKIGKAAKDLGIKLYRLHGDEFAMLGENKVNSRKLLDKLTQAGMVEVLARDVTTGEVVPHLYFPEFSVGVGATKKEADNALTADKQEREARDVRANKKLDSRPRSLVKRLDSEPSGREGSDGSGVGPESGVDSEVPGRGSDDSEAGRGGGQAGQGRESSLNRDRARAIILDTEMNSQKKKIELNKLAKEMGLTKKQVQEYAETILVEIAREVAGDTELDSKQKFDRLVEIYEGQPKMSTKSGESKLLQAYSTPLPYAFAAGMMADITGNETVYEPTAGMGALVMSADMAKTHVNELGEGRLAALKEQDWGEVTGEDASEYVPDRKSDVVIMNPPFGKLPGGPKFIDGFKISKLDHMVVINALMAMKGNGRAVMIIGADKTGAKVGKADRIFLNYLMNNYNVKDVFDLEGKMYERQGASWPTRVIVIDGKKAVSGEEDLAPKSIDRLGSWDEVYNRALEAKVEGVTDEDKADRPDMDTGRGPADSGPETVVKADDDGDAAEVPSGDDGQTGRGDGRGGVKSVPSQPVTKSDRGATDTASDTGAVISEGDTETRTPAVEEQPGETVKQDDEAEQVKEEPEDGERADDDSVSEPDVFVDHDKPKPEQDQKKKQEAKKKGTDLQDYYQSESGGMSLDTLVPKFMADGIKKALAKITKQEGSVDQYVADKLGYDSVEQMHEGLAAEQVDSLAMAINQLESGGSMVIGDQTGIGKGRQAAGLIRYAKLKGYTPVFITEGPKLYTDMYGDLQSIGTKANPFLMGQKGKSSIVDKDTKVIQAAKTPDEQKALMADVIAGRKKISDLGDMVFATYSQINAADNIQQKFLQHIADKEKNIIILDEAHKGSGKESTTGGFLKGGEITKGKGEDRTVTNYDGILNGKSSEGVIYLSATWAKNPDSMSLYFKTKMGDAIDNLENLESVFVKGGVALQQAVSNALAQAGQYIRREKSFEGVQFNSKTVGNDNMDKLVKDVDATSEVLRDIVAFSSKAVDAITEIGGGRGTANTESALGTTEFSSVVHNYVKQMLLSAKIDYAIDEVLEARDRGEKSVVTVTNTMGAFLGDYASENEIKPGEDLSVSFGDVLQRALDRTMRASQEDVKGNHEIHQFSAAQLGLQSEYDDIVEKIGRLDTSMPLSPIDWMYYRLGKEGMSVGELTARSHSIKYTGENKGTYEVRSEKAKDKNKHVNAFNSGETDVLIINSAGSTGLSLHASKQFKDQSPRHMVVVQPDPDINVFMQTLGRILRTGLAGEAKDLAKYTMLTLPLEAERRPGAILGGKMKSLNANTTSNTESSVQFETLDIFNKYGDEIATQILAADGGLRDELGIDLKTRKDGTAGVVPDMARKMTGRMAIFPNERQKEVYDVLLAEYASYVETLKANGEYDLEIDVREDWEAERIGEPEVVSEGSDNSDMLTSDVVMQEFKIKDNRKPATMEDVNKALNEMQGTTDLKEVRQKVKDDFKKMIGDAKKAGKAFVGEMPELLEAKEGESDKQREAREKRNDAKMQKFQDRKDSVEGQLVQMRNAMQKAVNTAGGLIDIESKGVIVSGYLVGIEYRKPKTGNPVRAGQYRAVFAVATPQKYSHLTAKAIAEQDVSFSVNKSGKTFDEIASEAVTTKIGFTGNLVKAVEYAETGKITSFRDKDGNVITALMMPGTWTRNRLVKDDRRVLKDANAVIDFLDAGAETGYNRKVFNENGGISITRERNDIYKLSVPSNKSGNKFSTDRELVSRLGVDFEGSSGTMDVKVDGAHLRKALSYLMKNGERFTSDAHQIEAINRANKVKKKKGGDGKSKLAVKAPEGKINRHKAASWASTETETKGGTKLLKRQLNDKKNEVGVRSIVDYLNEALSIAMSVGRANLSERYPAHYRGYAHAIRAKSGSWQGMFHEAGHGLSAMTRDRHPKWLKSMEEELMELTRVKGSMASAKSVEEGFAELVRKYVTNQGALDSGLLKTFETFMRAKFPDLLGALRDSHRAYVYHINRPISEQMQTYTNDQPKSKGLIKSVVDMKDRALMSLIGGSIIATRIETMAFDQIAGQSPLSRLDFTGIIGKVRSLIDNGYASRQKLAQDYTALVKKGNANLRSAWQTSMDVQNEVNRVMLGEDGEGLRVVSNGGHITRAHNDIEAAEVALRLEQLGFEIGYDFYAHGDTIELTDKSYAQIKREVGAENWGEFERYGQYRVALERYTEKKHLYPGIHDGLTPNVIADDILRAEEEHPEWKDSFKDVEKLLMQSLIVSYMSGEKSAKDLFHMKQKWVNYWPLPRKVEEEGSNSVNGPLTSDSGIRGAHGSMLPFVKLDDAVRQRLTRALNAYAQNRLMQSVVNMAKTAQRNKDIDFEARGAIGRLMTPMHLDTKKMATLKDSEQGQIIADYIDQQAAKEAGLSLKDYRDLNEGGTKPEDIDILKPGRSIWRSAAPNAPRVVAIYTAPGIKYYQVTDPLLFDLFAGQTKIDDTLSFVTGVAGGVTAPWKRLLTNNIAFAVRNIVRDAALAMFNARTKKGLIPGYYAAVGAVGMLRGDKRLNGAKVSELLSKTIRFTGSESHKTWHGKFWAFMKEGIVPEDYGHRTWRKAVQDFPGQGMSLLVKPIEMAAAVFGGRVIPEVSEALTRNGAFLDAKADGLSDEQANLEKANITGNFGQRGLIGNLSEIVRVAGFLNPALQVLNTQADQMFNADPKVRRGAWAIKLPLVSAFSATAAALNYLAMKAMFDDDEFEEKLENMRERPDEYRMGSMSVFGTVNLPFDYGVIGSAQSYGWNAVEGWLLEDPINAEKNALGLIKRAGDLPGLSDLINPFMKTSYELWANHSLYYNKEIVPAWMLARFPNNPELHAFSSTEKVYKDIGKALGASPIKVRYAARAIFSGQATKAIRYFSKKAAGEPVDRSEMPVVGRLLETENIGWKSASVQELRDLETEYQTALTAYKAAVKSYKEGDLPEKEYEEVKSVVNSLKRNHQAWLQTERVYKLIKAERKKDKPNYDRIKELEKKMTAVSKKFIKK